jgi:hypothetical protein
MPPALIVSTSPLPGASIEDFPGDPRLGSSALLERVHRIADAGISDVSFWRPIGGAACARLRSGEPQ